MADGYALRAYTGAADLRRMQSLVSSRFGVGVEHPGDLAWAMRDNGHIELGARVALAERPDGALVGWTWFHLNGWFDAVSVGEPRQDLADTLVRAALDTAARCAAAGDALERLTGLCPDNDPHLAAALSAQGFTEMETDLEVTRRALDDLPALDPPAGYRVRGMEDDDLVHERVECHRAAFVPSSLTAAGLRRVHRTWPYRPELDRVVLDADGRVVASCLGWYDPQSGWGLLEPVGTRPSHQRQGLATLACLDALHRLREAGAHSAQVSCESGSAGCATYHGLGFRTVQRLRMYRRPTSPD
jgi:predicted N-acetyltransferase YhbS